MSLVARASSTLQLLWFRSRRSLSLGSLLALLCIVATPALAVTYSDSGDGTVTDPTTGLIWMRCPMGQIRTVSIGIGTSSNQL